jgi:xanthine/CO dehydrogenase XdhC/CoxF family maturation factor
MKNIYLQFLDHQTGNSALAIATVTRSLGSTTQKPGSSELFGINGSICGTVGDVVEGMVAKIAEEALATGKSTHSTIYLNNDISNKIDAICDGQINVLVDANPANYTEVFEQLKSSLQNSVSGVLVTMVTKFSEDSVLINRYWITQKYVPPIPENFISALVPEVKEMLADGKTSGYREMELSIPDEEPSSLFFLEAIFPPA